MRLVPPAGVATRQRREIQLFDDIHDEARQVVIGQPLVHRRRQEIVGLADNGDEAANGVVPVMAA